MAELTSNRVTNINMHTPAANLLAFKFPLAAKHRMKYLPGNLYSLPPIFPLLRIFLFTRPFLQPFSFRAPFNAHHPADDEQQGAITNA
ncbi:hypothetical protein NXS98_00045 [Fontisphaera persica]|uniref:hypothetical protein n=1 Tax=Fontisphaera persica TaxID=2974023 RepID=UPI0024BF3762|nr:hypothetical protein [Fontisphaera persica]WCJ59544.1 hypothetical protein NXS98_00045 [Fontisphaera persica]